MAAAPGGSGSVGGGAGAPGVSGAPGWRRRGSSGSVGAGGEAEVIVGVDLSVEGIVEADGVNAASTLCVFAGVETVEEYAFGALLALDVAGPPEAFVEDAALVGCIVERLHLRDEGTDVQIVAAGLEYTPT